MRRKNKVIIIILILLVLIILYMTFINNCKYQKEDNIENNENIITKNKTLVIILSETRAHELTFDNVKTNLIDNLNADVCLCIGAKSDYDYTNPFYKIAKYKFIYDETNDKNFYNALTYSYNEICKDNTKCTNYMDFLKYKDRISTENNDPTSFSNFIISTWIHIFFLWFLKKNLTENNLIEQYDRFIITRSDMMYTLPHPKLELLDPKYIWILNDEHHGGYCDRHVVLSSNNIGKYINILDNIFINSNEYINEITKSYEWNMERILKLHLFVTDTEKIIKQFPYVMFAVRGLSGTSRWSNGEFNKELNCYIKYPNEYERSHYYKKKFEESNMNISDFYKSLI